MASTPNAASCKVHRPGAWDTSASMGARIDLLLAVRRTPGPGTELVASGCRRRLTSQQPHLLLVGVDILDRAVGSDHVSARVDAHPLSDGGFCEATGGICPSVKTAQPRSSPWPARQLTSARRR